MRLATYLAMVTNGWKLARYSKHIKERVVHADGARPEAKDGKLSTRCDGACQHGTLRVKEKMGQLSSKCFEHVQRFHHSDDDQQ